MLYLVILLLCHVILGADPPSITDVNFIKTTLEAHNLIRSKVTPTASNMKYMTWDSDLAKIAKSWTSKCIFDHNTNLLMKGLHPVFSPVGENLLMGPGTEMMGITKKWADEVAYYNFDTNGCLTGKMCGHYTQVVWANSYKVGCAATKCPGSYGFIVACNYGPALFQWVSPFNYLELQFAMPYYCSSTWFSNYLKLYYDEHTIVGQSFKSENNAR
ncbi:glioma pathogenesis-related protein 1-like isoform X3 [Pseudophryne corroboree]|uniref:glioma pathogenesis-related protein 1-like isoform X3 n=1 Tax=Pseudophryne corroboree TaxID=495146 RepID=UPI0030818326